MRPSTGPSELHAGAGVAASFMLALALAAVPASADMQTPNPQTPNTQAPNAAPAPPVTKPAVPKSATQTSAAAKSAGPPSRYLPDRFAGRAGLYYKAIWGVDQLTVKLTESGEVVRFSWRVLDPDRAKPLSEKSAEPSLEDPRAGVSLVVPAMENIGKLRQESTPEAGKAYWMVFSNKGRHVKRGDRVNVVIGQFRANNLAVD
jgi:hypothetical protein